jgi:hypothetical protein
VEFANEIANHDIEKVHIDPKEDNVNEELIVDDVEGKYT